MRITALAVFALLTTSAWAHGPAQWIADRGIKNAVGELCCGEQDCGYMVSGKATAVEGGYSVNAVFRIEPPGREPILHEVHEFVPYAEAQPSPTGEFWRCEWGGQRKCFFAPLPGS